MLSAIMCPQSPLPSFNVIEGEGLDLCGKCFRRAWHLVDAVYYMASLYHDQVIIIIITN